MTSILQCVSPVDGSICAQQLCLSFEEACQRLQQARKAQQGWAIRSMEERLELVLAGVDLLESMMDEIIPELAWQTGCPISHGKRLCQIKEPTIHMASIAESALQPITVENSPTTAPHVIRRFAMGLGLVIAPWNAPYAMAIGSIVPALIAGNAVFLWHCSQTLLVGKRLERAFHAAGIPGDILQNLPLDAPTLQALIADKAFNFVASHNALHTGKATKYATAPAAAEPGSRNAALVFADADLEKAAAVVMDEAMLYSGQCTGSIKRIYASQSIFDDFVERCCTLVHSHVLGNPLDPQSTLGPMVNHHDAITMRAYITQAMVSGAKALVEPSQFPHDNGDLYVPPQILIHADHNMDMAILQEKILGPVISITPVSKPEQAAPWINDNNDTGQSLTSLWTQDHQRAEYLANRLSVRTVTLNQTENQYTGYGHGRTDPGLDYQAITHAKSYIFPKASGTNSQEKA